MKNIPNGFGRSFTAAVVMLCMLFSIFAPTILAASDLEITSNEKAETVEPGSKGELNYVSIGDSMTNGYCFDGYEQGDYTFKDFLDGNGVYGKDAYPLQFEKDLENKGYTVNHTKLALSALRAEDLLFLLGGKLPVDRYTRHSLGYAGIGTTNAYEKGENNWGNYLTEIEAKGEVKLLKDYVVESIENAHVITLGMGNASFGAFLMDRLTRIFGVFGLEKGVHVDIHDALEGLSDSRKEAILDLYNDLMAGIDLSSFGNFPEESMDEATDLFAYTVVSYLVSYMDCVERIIELNPDVEIIFMGLVNTTYGMNVTDENGEVIFELGNWMDELFASLDEYVKMIPTIIEADKVAPEASFYFVAQPDEPDFICQAIPALAEANWGVVDRLNGAIVRDRNIDAYNENLRPMLGGIAGTDLPEVDLELVQAVDSGDMDYVVNKYSAYAQLYATSALIYLGIEDAVVECINVENLALDGLMALATDLSSAFEGFALVTGDLRSDLADFLVENQPGLCKIYAMFKVGNGMSVHPTPAGHDVVAANLIKVYSEGKALTYDSKTLAIRDVFYYLEDNGYMTLGDVLAIREQEDTSVLGILKYVYNTVLAENDITDDERIAIIGKVYTILKGDFLGNYSPALDTVGNIYDALHPEYLSNTEAFNIVDYVYDRIIDLKVSEQDIYEIATYIYKTLFKTEMTVSLAADYDLPEEYAGLTVGEKLEIINIVFGELENSEFVAEAPELAPMMDLYVELRDDENVSPEALVAIFDIAFETVAEKTESGEEVDTTTLVTEVTTKLATTDKISLAEKAIIVNKVVEAVKDSNLGATTDTPVIPDIPDLTKIVGVLDRLDDKYITMDEANMLLGKAVELLVADNLNKETAVELIKEAYDIVLADLSDEEKLDFVVDLYEAIKAEYDLTDEEVVAIVLDVVVEYYDEAYAEAYKYADQYGYVAVVADALGVAIDAVFAAMDAVDGVDFNATLKADTLAILAKVIAALDEIKTAVEAGNLADVEGLVNTVLALEDELYASLDALAALGIDVIDIVVIPAIEDAIEFIETQVIPEAIKLAGEIAELAIQYLLETLDETYKYLVEMIVDAVKEYAPVAAEALYNYLLNNPDDVIWFFQNYGHYIADFFAEYGDEALAVVAYLAYTYGEDILAFVVENHAEIIEAFVYIVREYGDEAWALIEVYAEATGLTAQIGKQLGAVKDAIEEQIEALKAQLRELENLLKNLKDELAGLEGKLEDLLAELEDLVNSLEGVAEDVKAEILAKIEALKALIESVKAQIEALKAQIAEIVALIEEIKAQIAELIAELQAVIAELEAIAAAVAELVDAIVALVEAIKDGAIDAILAAIEAIKAAIENLLGVIDAADLLMKHLAALADALASLAEFIAENIEAIKNALECIAGKLAELVDAIYAISDKLEAIIAALDALLGELLDDIKALVAELVASVKAQIAELLAMIDALVAEFNAAYEALMAVLPGIVELAKDKLDVLAADLEAAVKEAIATVDTVKENIETFVAMAEFLYYMATNGYYEVDDEESHYVALGDGSAAEGSYADMLAELLGVKYDNLAQGGFIAKDVLDTILANQDIIADADLITLGFSNATVLDFVMSGVLGYGEVDWAALFGEEVAEVAERVLAKVSAKLAEVIAKELEGELDAESLELFVDMGVSALEAYVYAYVAHVMTLPEILETLGELAPNALIVVVGGYNDLEGAVIELDGVTVDLGEYIGYVVKALNLEALLLAMTGYNVVYVDAPDVETILEAEAEGELSILAYLEAVLSGNLLPSAAGHEYILDQILAAVEVDKLVAHVHEYDAVCDDTCNICGAKRVAMPHAYYHVCDADCNVCGFIREVEGHKYTADCDTTCNNCGEVREAAAHTFGDWVVTRESTKNVMGEKTRTCSKCGAVEWELLPVIPADKNEVAAESGLSTGAVVAIVAIPSVFALGAGGFAAFWFGYKKRSLKDLTDAISKLFASLAK